MTFVATRTKRWFSATNWNSPATPTRRNNPSSDICERREEMNMITGALLVGPALLLAACTTGSPPGRGGEVSFDLNRGTVASVEPQKVTFGYGLSVEFSDSGCSQLRKLTAGGPEYIVFMVNGNVLSREMLLGGSFPCEMVWVHSVGIDELTREQADSLTRQILAR